MLPRRTMRMVRNEYFQGRGPYGTKGGCHRVHRSGMGHHPSGGGIDRGIELDHTQPIGLPDALGSINLRQLAVKQRDFLEFLFQIGKLLSG